MKLTRGRKMAGYGGVAGARAALAGTFALLLAGFCPAAAQSLSGLHIGDAAPHLQELGKPVATAPDGPYLNQKWTFPTGNDLAVSTSADGLIVYLESDWGGHSGNGNDDPGCDLPGVKFGSTTLADLRKRFGSNGFVFQNRSPLLETDDGVVLFNAYEVGTKVVTFITKASKQDYARSKQGGAGWDLADHAKLDAILIADGDYAVYEWGPRVYDPGYKKIEWK